MRLTRFLIVPFLAAFSAFGADSALLNLVMPEARIVAGMDVERAKDSVLGRKLLAEMHSKDNEFGKMVAATGFDPRRDIREVLIAAVDTSGKNTPGLVLVRGTFDVARITAFAKTAGSTVVDTVGTIEIYTAPDKKNSDDGVFALVDSSLALGGSKDLVRAALLRRGGNAAPMTAESVARVQSMSRSNDVWLVSTGSVADLTKALPGGQGKSGDTAGNMMNGDAFKTIEQMAMGVRFAAEMIELSAETVSRTEKDATAIADVVRFLSSMVQLNREKPEMKGLATALEGMKLTTEARTTRLWVSLPTAEFEKAIEKKAKPVEKKI